MIAAFAPPAVRASVVSRLPGQLTDENPDHDRERLAARAEPRGGHAYLRLNLARSSFRIYLLPRTT